MAGAATLWRMRALAIAAVLALGGALGLARAAAPPFGELWHVDGVSVSDDGYWISLRWTAAGYRLQLPGRRAIDWERGDDIRLMSDVVISCRVPGGTWGSQQLAAHLEFPLHPDAKPEADEASRKIVTAADGGLLAFFAALAGREGAEEIPVRVGLGRGGAEHSSLRSRSALALGAKWSVKPLEPDWMLSALVSQIVVSLTVDGERARAELRFEPDPELARAGRIMAQCCKGR